MGHTTDIDLETGDILELGSLDAVVSFFNKLGYDTGKRAPLTPEAIGLAGDSAKALKKVELISEDSEQFMRVVFAQSRSLTAKVRNDLARVGELRERVPSGPDWVTIRLNPTLMVRVVMRDAAHYARVACRDEIQPDDLWQALKSVGTEDVYSWARRLQLDISSDSPADA